MNKNKVISYNYIKGVIFFLKSVFGPTGELSTVTSQRECFYLEDVDENALLGLLGAADVLQDDGVVHALRVRLVQVVGVRLVPLLEGQEDLVLVCAHDLNVLPEEEEGVKIGRVRGEIAGDD